MVRHSQRPDARRSRRSLTRKPARAGLRATSGLTGTPYIHLANYIESRNETLERELHHEQCGDLRGHVDRKLNSFIFHSRLVPGDAFLIAQGRSLTCISDTTLCQPGTQLPVSGF